MVPQARIVLLAAEGLANQPIAERGGVSRPTIICGGSGMPRRVWTVARSPRRPHRESAGRHWSAYCSIAANERDPGQNRAPPNIKTTRLGGAHRRDHADPASVQRGQFRRDQVLDRLEHLANNGMDERRWSGRLGPPPNRAAAENDHYDQHNRGGQPADHA